MMIIGDNEGKKALAGELYVLLADAFTMSFRAQAAHWNVKGPDFHQYHGFFGMIYEDVEDSIDPTAENIRKLGFDAPLNLMDMCSTTMIAEQQCACDPLSLVSSLNIANDVVIARLNSVFAVATECNEQAIADFAAGRLDKHQKWAWQMRTTLGMDSGMPGKSVADSLVMAPGHGAENQPIVMFDSMLAAGASRAVRFSDSVEHELAQKVDAHNKKTSASCAATLDRVRAVYRRGASGHLLDPQRVLSVSANVAGMRRVDAYLSSLKESSRRTSSTFDDADLLPDGHGLAAAVCASAAAISDEMTVTLRSGAQSSPDSAIVSLAEFSGLGYEIVPALRAAWKRGVESNESGYMRAGELAVKLYDSSDADLLPHRV